MAVYILYPEYLGKKKYVKFFSSIFVLTIVTYSLFYVVISNLWNLNTQPFDTRIVNIWHASVYFATAGPPVVCCLFLFIKMLKNYYFQMENKATLLKENANAELQLLKAQVHPHFLFNTLNNIYSFILNQSPCTKGLITKLSDTLKYMINDCEGSLVPLEKELKMIRDYIGLEKVRYDERLNLTIKIEGAAENKLIAPLFLIPFVENTFKHGSSRTVTSSWIRLNILIEANDLHMEIRNSKPIPSASQNRQAGIGLKNVEKRLQLLYPGQHELIIKSTDDEFSVEIKIPLQQLNVKNNTTQNAEYLLREYQSQGYV
ncbi:MAG: histidine kinase [Chitinophagaceae bacterium]